MIPVILTITQGLNAVSTFGPIAFDIALKFKKVFAGQNSTEPFEVQIQVYEAGILRTINETDAIWAAWTAKTNA